MATTMPPMRAAISAGMSSAVRDLPAGMAWIQQEYFPVTTAEYGLSKAARPFNSRLEKSKLVRSRISAALPVPGRTRLSRYLKESEAVTCGAMIGKWDC